MAVSLAVAVSCGRRIETPNRRDTRKPQTAGIINADSVGDRRGALTVHRGLDHPPGHRPLLSIASYALVFVRGEDR
jgi:hypothetical protein